MSAPRARLRLGERSIGFLRRLLECAITFLSANRQVFHVFAQHGSSSHRQAPRLMRFAQPISGRASRPLRRGRHRILLRGLVDRQLGTNFT